MLCQPDQLSQDLTLDRNYLMTNPEIASSQQSIKFEIDNQPPSQTLTQLNQSLIDHENTVLATSAPSSQSFE